MFPVASNVIHASDVNAIDVGISFVTPRDEVTHSGVIFVTVFELEFAT